MTVLHILRSIAHQVSLISSAVSYLPVPGVINLSTRVNSIVVLLKSKEVEDLARQIDGLIDERREKQEDV